MDARSRRLGASRVLIGHRDGGERLVRPTTTVCVRRFFCVCRVVRRWRFSMDHSDRDRSSRGTFIRGAAAAGIGAVLAGASAKVALDASAAGTRADTVPSILATLLMTERLATIFYYTALTSPAVMR